MNEGSDNIKKTITIISVSAILAAGILAGTVRTRNNKTENTTTLSEITVQKYILKDYNGRIAVFYDGSETPNEIYEIYTRSLPAEDIAKIEKGIEISGIDKLTEILEDYTS